MAIRTKREEGVKGISKADSTWISRGREKESKGAGGWSSFPEMGSLQEAWVWDVSGEHRDNTQDHWGAKVVHGERKERREGVCAHV